MKISNSKTLLLVVLMSISTFVVFNSLSNVTTADNTGITAYKISTDITLDGIANEAAWAKADRIIITDYKNADDASLTADSITLSFVQNGTHIFTSVQWTDPTATKNDWRRNWQWNETSGEFENLRNSEDRLTLAWSMSGDALVCGHNSDGTTAGDIQFDVWHWKAHRSDPAGWVDDKYFDGTGRHGDAKTSGGYKENSVVVQLGDAAAATLLGNSSNVASHKTGLDLPYWFTNGTVIPWSAGALANSTYLAEVGTDDPTLVGYITSVPVGSRGDISVASNYVNGMWSIEEVRKLDTGHADDIKFVAGNSYDFYVAVHDNSGDESHYANPSIKLTLAISDDVSEKTTVVEMTTVVEATTVVEKTTVDGEATTTKTIEETKSDAPLSILFAVFGLVSVGLVVALRRRK